MLPVPLNSSKITSSMREPVSTSAVARMVSEPPSSMLRAAPKNLFGGNSAVESTPPDRMRPLAGVLQVVGPRQRVMRVEQDDDVPADLHQALDALEHQLGDLRRGCQIGWSKVEATTSPLTERCMSVTSSGRSSTSSTMR